MQDARVIQNELHFTATHSRVVAKKKKEKNRTIFYLKLFINSRNCVMDLSCV